MTIYERLALEIFRNKTHLCSPRLAAGYLSVFIPSPSSARMGGRWISFFVSTCPPRRRGQSRFGITVATLLLRSKGFFLNVISETALEYRYTDSVSQERF